jgi:hypothetical protein
MRAQRGTPWRDMTVKLWQPTDIQKSKKNGSDVAQLNRLISLSCLAAITLAEGAASLCNLLSLYAVQPHKREQRSSIRLWFYIVSRPLPQPAYYSFANSFSSLRSHTAGVSSLRDDVLTAERNKLGNFMPLLLISEPYYCRRHSDWLLAGRSTGGSSSLCRVKYFLFSTSSREALELIQPPIWWATGTFSKGLKLPGREADNSPETSADMKKTSVYNSIRLYDVMLN